MKFLKMLGFMVLGGLMMLALMAYMSQFFGGEEERIPVIRLTPSTPNSQQTGD